MKRLDESKTRTVDGVKLLHKQIYRKDMSNGKCVCIFEVKKEGCEDVDSYEVFIPRVQKKDVEMPTGYISPAGEKYPGNNDFGRNAVFISGQDKYKRAYRAAEQFEQRILKSIQKKRDAKNVNQAAS